MPTTDTRALRLDTIRLSDNPLHYYPDEGLLKAFEIAIALGKPLLLSGEPGTGKTKFAYWAAQKLANQTAGQSCAFLPAPFIFPVKSVSQAADLFYHYDAVGHFRSGKGAAQEFINLSALGQAIIRTHGADSEEISALQGIHGFPDNSSVGHAGASSIVLIDEIDKAPREFPNDLLHEIENYSFRIPEMAASVGRSRKNPCRIVPVITSNSEKNLPNAFLRRCVFYHINFPEDKLLEIAKLKLQIGDNAYDGPIKVAITEFMKLRAGATNKKPTTSEFLDWIGVLKEQELLKGDTLPPANGADLYKASMSTLLKTTDDLRTAQV